ncbi:uncharacterized protein LOC127467097 [Manacus candei]|uniref:uncharacterized protein LOC127467097 n=1 Tax=Manacus candei TaxID=415023 RepID=UPI0022267C0E|nr:uncharacterized protein LOC127467097 [Manacus candei]
MCGEQGMCSMGCVGSVGCAGSCAPWRGLWGAGDVLHGGICGEQGMLQELCPMRCVGSRERAPWEVWGARCALGAVFHGVCGEQGMCSMEGSVGSRECAPWRDLWGAGNVLHGGICGEQGMCSMEGCVRSMECAPWRDGCVGNRECELCSMGCVGSRECAPWDVWGAGDVSRGGIGGEQGMLQEVCPMRCVGSMGCAESCAPWREVWGAGDVFHGTPFLFLHPPCAPGARDVLHGGMGGKQGVLQELCPMRCVGSRGCSGSCAPWRDLWGSRGCAPWDVCGTGDALGTVLHGGMCEVQGKCSIGCAP